MELDNRINQFIEATERLKLGDYNVLLPSNSSDELDKLGQALLELAQSLETRYRQMQKLVELTADINAGLMLDSILEKVYQNFQEFIPYNRIGFSLLEEGSDGVKVRAYWAKSDQPVMKISKGYSALLAGSSLETIIATRQPRIINNLVDYLQKKPQSQATALIVEEGMRASLTCPLIANGVPVGFMFFSSIHLNTYATVHVDTFQSIAGQLAVILEKGRLVSELAQQNAAIETQNKELLRLNELKNRFLGIAAHDLRGSLGNIQLGSVLLRDIIHELSPAEQNSILKDITGQTAFMLELIDDLLDVAQIESGNLDLALKSIDLLEFLADAVHRHNQVAVTKGTQVILSEAPPDTITADPRRLRQVLDNLMSNAVKFSPPGSTVEISVDRRPGGWQFNIKDQGPGITPADRERLFKDFSRLSAKPTGGEKSTGLGLAITRRMVEAHGGRIDVTSEPGRGATFWFYLPKRTSR